MALFGLKQLQTLAAAYTARASGARMASGLNLPMKTNLPVTTGRIRGSGGRLELGAPGCAVAATFPLRLHTQDRSEWRKRASEELGKRIPGNLRQKSAWSIQETESEPEQSDY